MDKEKLRTALAAAAFFLLIGTAALLSSGNFLGRTLGAAFFPERNGPDKELSEEARKIDADLKKLEPLPPEAINTETLWLARCIYSETKRPREQEMVAWVVRNRVETNYRGNDSYREAVLDPFQFSAFNPGSRKRGYYSSLDPRSSPPGWKRALGIAQRVINAPPSQRPFSAKTRHFFSERSMRDHQSPGWAKTHKKVTPAGYEINERRFRFYKDIS